MSGQPDRPEQEAASSEADIDDAAAEDVLNEADSSGEGGDDAEVADIQAQADQNWDKYLRTMAELDNVRKRAARDVENARKYALEPFSRELLAVRDSLEMGLNAAGDDPTALREGTEATLKLLVASMEQFGITELDPTGEPFDPQQHEAMMMQPSAEAEPGTVLTVYQKGYSLNGRLLRPARVVVADALPE